MRRALIVGVTGQDGAYLSRLLLDKGYAVFGTSRSADGDDHRLAALGARDAVEMLALEPTDPEQVSAVLKRVDPAEIYNFSGQSSVAQSFQEPVATLSSIVVATQNLLEAIRHRGRDTGFYNAGSSECFGDIGDRAADETTPFSPKSPYGVAKSCAFWQVATYRSSYRLRAATGILFNHESCLRRPQFVTMKIIGCAWEIAHGQQVPLVLGDIEIERDWGWAPDYVEAMWRMMQQSEMSDYVVATGVSISLKAFATRAFAYFGLKLDDHLRIDASLKRPNELRTSRANPARARTGLGWSATWRGLDLVDRLCADYAAERNGYAAEPLLRRLKSRVSPLLKNPRINALRGVPMPEVTGEAAQRAIARMVVEGGRLVARVGETEGRAAAHYLMRRMSTAERATYMPLNRERLKALAGYFPTTDDGIDRLARCYIQAIRRIDLYAAWTPHDRLLCPRQAVTCTLRDIDPFFTVNRWPNACAGQRVTVVSPFRQTILAQWPRRSLLFAQPTMPECELSVVQAPQTQCEEDVAGQDWFENLGRLDEAVAATAPDTVIIGAGAYGLPLGAMAVARGATAVVMGGSTQLLFGIMGNRWARDREYLALQNAHWTRPGVEERPLGFQHFETAGGAYW